MDVVVLPDADAAARKAAAIIADEARTAIAARGKFVVAVSGGKSPWAMLRAMVDEELPWERIHVVQVDERVAPAGHSDRNLTHIQSSFVGRAAQRAVHVHAMPVESGDLEAAAGQYARVLLELAGSPSVLDLVHLGLGTDGHTASLVPGDPVLGATRDVAVTLPYQQRLRMTLTYPIINRARRILWLVTGPEKAPMLDRLVAGDATVPAGRIRTDNAIVIADASAAAQLAA